MQGFAQLFRAWGRLLMLGALSLSIGAQASAFVHPGLLQTEEDFIRIRE